MRILFVLPRMVSGGVERVTLRLIEQFLAEGHDCALAIGHTQGELLEEARSIVCVYGLADDGLWRFIPRLSRVISEWRPTHIVTAFADVGLMTVLAKAWARSPAVIVHGVHDTHGAEVARPGWRGRLRHALYCHIARQVYRRVDLIVAVSDGVASEVRSMCEASADRVRTIRNPVVPDGFAAPYSSARSKNAPTRILAMGRLVRQKGFDILLRAVPLLPRDKAWLMEIYGEGPERPLLEDLIMRSGFADRVSLKGFAADPFSVLSHGDVFVLPSRHEGLGNVLIEAMACGCQLVATDCRHGPREILADGKFGLLVVPQNPQALADALNEVLTGGWQCDSLLLAERAREFSVAASGARWVQALGDAENMARQQHSSWDVRRGRGKDPD